MEFNEMNILFIVNVIFVLILNLQDFKNSIVLEFKSFFETHVYTVLPPSLQIFVSTFVNALFDFLLINEKMNKSIDKLYAKTNLSSKAEESENVLLSTLVFALSIFVYIIEICLHFVLLSLFFIYIKQIFTFLTNIDETSNSEQKTKAYILIIVGFIFYKVVKFIASINYKVTFLQFMKYCLTFLLIVVISFVSYYSISTTDIKKDMELSNVNINVNMKYIMELLNDWVTILPTIAVGLVCIYTGLTLMFVFYDVLFSINYNKIKEQKRKIFYSFFFILFSIVISMF